VAPGSAGPPFDRFPATAEAVARARPEVDLEPAREVFSEVFDGAATLLHDGLALDGLALDGLALDGPDGHDSDAVVAGLCVEPVAGIPAPRCAHVPGQRWSDPGSCTTREGCPPRTWSLHRSCSSERGTHRVDDLGYRAAMDGDAVAEPVIPS
jgi:uncharacterized Zn-binding protein involved in type VI secretion